MATNSGSKNVVIFLRVPEEVRDEIKRMATKEHRNQGNMTAVLILEALKARKNHVRSSN